MHDAFSNNPQRAVPPVGADRKSMAPECKFSSDILSRPEEFSPSCEAHTGHEFNTMTERPEPHCRDSEADALIVLLGFQGNDAEQYVWPEVKLGRMK